MGATEKVQAIRREYPSPKVESLGSTLKIKLTFDDVKKELGEKCPDAVVREVLKSKNPEEKIEEIKTALDEISKAVASGRELGKKLLRPYTARDDEPITEVADALKNEHVAKLFVKYTKEFVSIAKAELGVKAFQTFENERVGNLFEKHTKEFIEMAESARWGTYDIFWALGDERVANLFEKHTKEFIDIIKANIDGDPGNYSYLRVFENERVAEIFDKHAKEFSEMAKAAGRFVFLVIESFENESIAELFVKHLDLARSFGDFANAAKKSTVEALELLTHKEFAGLFIKNPDIVIYAFSGIGGVFLETPTGGSVDPFEILKKNEKSLKQLVDELGSLVSIMEDRRAKFLLRFHYSKYKATEDGELSMPSWEDVDKEKLMRKLELVNKTFGIEFFERYSQKFIDHLYEMALSPSYQNGKPTALMIYNKSDDTNAFARVGRLDSLLAGYRVIAVEVDDDEEALKRLESAAKKYGKLDFLLLAGHGHPDQLRLGNTRFESYTEGDKNAFVDIGDLKRYGGKGALERYLNSDGIVVLFSCWTGGEYPWDLGNLMSMMGILTNRKVFAPRLPTWIKGFVFDKNSKVIDVEWAEEGDTDIGRKYEPSSENK